MTDSSAPPSKAKSSPSSLPTWLTWVLPSTAEVCFLTLILVLLFGRSNRYFILDGDPGWHIRAGQFMWETHSIPHHDIFSFSMPGAWWVTWEWGTEVVFAALHQWGGLNAVVFFIVVVLAATYTLLYKFLRSDGFSFVTSFSLLLFVILGSSFHWVARPHVLSYPFVIAYFFILDRFMGGRTPAKTLWALPVLMILWVNLHAGFLAGLMIVGTFLLSDLFRLPYRVSEERRQIGNRLRVLLGIALACLFASLLNPNGYGLYLYIVEYFKTVHLLNPINELSSPSFQMVIFQPFLAAVIALIFLLRYSRYRLRLEETLSVALWMGLSLLSLRNIPILLLIGAPIYGRLIEGLKDPWEARFPAVLDSMQRLVRRIERSISIEQSLRVSVLTVGVLFTFVWIVAHQGVWPGRQVMNFRFLEQHFPVGAVEYLKTRMPQGNVFNECLMGGYLIYNFYPNFKVFIDGRLDFYGEPFSREYVNAINTPEGGGGKPSWQQVFERYKIRWTILRPDFPLRYALEADPGWTRVYHDAKAVIFVKKN